MTDKHEFWMGHALDAAKQAWRLGEVPIGAVVVYREEVVATGTNRTICDLDPSGHAEIVAIRKAAKLIGNYRLVGATLYSTLEPCPMCVGAILQARIATVCFGAHDVKAGALGGVVNLMASKWNHEFNCIAGVRQEECRELLQKFFQLKR